MEDQSRYEVVPKKESKVGKAFKSFGQYLKLIAKSTVESFKYNKMKLPGILIGLPGLLIGLFLSSHAATIKQLTFTYSYTKVEGSTITKVTDMWSGMPYDYTGIVIFVLMLVAILNIFVAIGVSGKQNLGSVVSATIITLIMIGLSAAYCYAVFYFKGLIGTQIPGAENGVTFQIAGFNEAAFTKNMMTSIIVIGISDVMSLIGCLLGFVHYNRAYEKVVER